MSDLDDQIDALEALMRKGNDILELKDKPVAGKTQESLCMDYLLLQQPSMSRAPSMAEEVFSVAEGQASWVVLREFEPDEKIAAYSREERLGRFVEELYRAREWFKFFDSREKALGNLTELGIIDAGRGRPPA